jgi:hypothetical protein
MEMNPERLWYGVPIPLTKLAEYDNCDSPVALPDALGDRYLCAHNPVFASVRRAALDLGYRFTSEDGALWRDYLALSLTTLNRIVTTKTIPYHSTGETLQRLIETNPRVALSPGFLLSSLKANFVLHESAHCVAHSVLLEREAAFSILAPQERERFVLSAALEESFANTAERLGTLSVYRPMADEIFYALNSNITQAKGFTKTLKKGEAELGEKLRFSLLLISSFNANLVGGEPDEAACERIMNVVGCDATDKETAREVIETGFSLNHRFREYTNPLYFEMLGYGKEYARVAKSDWPANPANHEFLNEVADALFGILTAGDREMAGVESVVGA